jgi:hypothetical protein
MSTNILGAVIITTLLPLLVSAKEGPGCAADPYVSRRRE